MCGVFPKEGIGPTLKTDGVPCLQVNGDFALVRVCCLLFAVCCLLFAVGDLLGEEMSTSS